MKRFLFFAGLAGLIIILSSWIFGTKSDYYTKYTPILMTRSQLNNSVHIDVARQLCQTGKIYYKDEYIYVNELYKGVHIIDNHDPTNPIPVGFIVIPGCIDIAIKNDVLYADNAVDLVAIQLSEDFSKVTVTQRIEDIFPEAEPPDGKAIRPEYNKSQRPENTIIVGWEKSSKN